MGRLTAIVILVMAVAALGLSLIPRGWENVAPGIATAPDGAGSLSPARRSAASLPAALEGLDRSGGSPAAGHARARLAAGGPKAAQADTAQPPGIRNVTPPDMTPGPKVTGPLERVESDLPVLPKAPPPSPKDPIPGVIVVDAGTLKAGDRTVHLADVEAPALDATCARADGAPWPCGRAAATALARLIRGRSVICAPLPKPGTAMPARCRVGNTDLSLWLVRNGWAEPKESADSELAIAAREAAAARRGLHGAGPETAPQTSPALALPLPGEDVGALPQGPIAVPESEAPLGAPAMIPPR